MVIVDIVAVGLAVMGEVMGRWGKAMTFLESICFAKVYAAAMGLAPRESVTKFEKDMAAEALKHMADQNLN